MKFVRNWKIVDASSTFFAWQSSLSGEGANQETLPVKVSQSHRPTASEEAVRSRGRRQSVSKPSPTKQRGQQSLRPRPGRQHFKVDRAHLLLAVGGPR